MSLLFHNVRTPDINFRVAGWALGAFMIGLLAASFLFDGAVLANFFGTRLGDFVARVLAVFHTPRASRRKLHLGELGLARPLACGGRVAESALFSSLVG